MIKITDRYSVKIDELNYALIKHSTVDVKEGDNVIGKKEVETNMGYYGNLQSLVKGLLNHKVKETAKEVESMVEIAEHIEGYCNFIDGRLKSELKLLELENAKLKKQLSGK